MVGMTHQAVAVALNVVLTVATLSVSALALGQPVQPAVQRTCSAASLPSVRAHLVELYTSQGCSSCPPADRWLSRLAAPVVPLSLHVKYWDYIGWKDPYAKEAFTERQRWLAQRGGLASVYTPGVFLNGREWADWSRADAQSRRLGSTSQGPALSLQVQAARSAGGWTVSMRGTPSPRLSQALGATLTERIKLFAAWTESGLGNAVTAGENRGETLRHDHVARHWAGPLRWVDPGSPDQQVTWPDRPGARGAFVVFAQDMQSGEVLQALRLNLADCT